MAAQVLPFRPPSTEGRIDRFERWRTNSRWGDLGATQLQSVLDEAGKGNVADWADLVEYAIGSDDLLVSLYTTRLTRVVQADWIVVPNEFGNSQLAQLAAEFVNEMLGRLQNRQQGFRDLLHAIAPGYSASEMFWERDGARRINYVSKLVHRHGHRFRYDEQWQLRLYDHGRRQGPTGYGELLDPRLWIVHTHQEQAGYPGVSGVMRSCVWRWMFRRWVDKFWIAHIEKHGSPLTYAKVQPDTPKAVRDKILTDLENLSQDQVGVIEEGGEIVVEAAASAAKSDESHERYMRFAGDSLTVAWLGIADAVEPGSNGSQSAVSTRASAAMDPRMVADGENLAMTLHQTLFAQLIRFNAHLFGANLLDIPVPTMRFKTAADEVVTDRDDLADEQQEQAESEPGRAPDREPRQMGLFPKAPPPKRRSTKTSQTTPGYRSPLSAALRGELAAPGSSLSRPKRKRRRS